MDCIASCLLVYVSIFCPIPSVQGQYDDFLRIFAIDQKVGFEQIDEQSSCEWVDAPEDGVNYKLCSTGVCRVHRGSYSENGTVRFTKCKKHHVLSEGYERDRCENRVWSSSGHQCIPCGRSRREFNFTGNTTTTDGGHYNASRGDFPWMVAVYIENDESTWEQICGGTLISSSLILSAAHCFYIQGSNLNAEKIKVGIGQISPDFDKPEPGSMIYNIKDIIRSKRYEGVGRLYGLDIALLVLSEPVDINDNIMPACVDWTASMKLQPNETGVVAGWGSSEVNGTIKPALRWVYKQYIGYDSCRTMVNQMYRVLLAGDKFCALELQGERMDTRDGGGAMTYVRDGVHYMYGIYSTKTVIDASRNHAILLFTDVLYDGHLTWLMRQWRNLQVQHGKIECAEDGDCGVKKKCRVGKCLDPCRRGCGANTSCKLFRHLTVCACKPYFTGDPLEGCHSDPLGVNSLNTTSPYSYLPAPHNSVLRFKVKASSDAHVMLSEVTYPVGSAPFIEIVLGGWNNSKSVIRDDRDNPAGVKVEVYTPDLLSDEEFRNFWMTYADGNIAVGRGKQISPFMSWTSSKPLNIKIVGIATDSGSTGNWIIYG